MIRCVERPETRYATTRTGVHIAYQECGEGPLDVVFNGPLVTHVELLWEDPGARRFLEGISSFARLILLDKRGSGMSDPIHGAPTIEERVEDLDAVLDAAGCEQPALLGCSEGGQVSALWAAANPERCRALAIYSSSPFSNHDPDRDPPGVPEAAFQFFLDLVERDWGGRDILRIVMPSVLGDPEREQWWTRFFRQAISPGAVKDQLRVNRDIDVSNALPTVQARTRVMHAGDELFLPPALGREFADLVPGATFVEMAGGDHLPYGENGPAVVAEVRELLTGERPAVEPERALATVLFTDIVDSTSQAEAAGDRRWRELLDKHDRALGDDVGRFGGQVVKTTGDGILATFDGPARAVRCAAAMRESGDRVGLEIRAGMHTGEVELRDGDIAGLAVHIAQRVSALAEAGQIVVSRTVVDLVVGSGIDFEDLGETHLKGVQTPWSVYSVRRV